MQVALEALERAGARARDGEVLVFLARHRHHLREA
jgi:hypothetical protein